MDEAGKNGTWNRPLYFVKINNSFVNSELESSLNLANNTLTSLTNQKSRLSIAIDALEGKTEEVQWKMMDQNPKKYGWRQKRNQINYLRKLLEKHWPESMNEKPEDVPDPKVEDEMYNKRTRELIGELSHRTNNIAEEKCLIKEFDHLYRRKEKLNHDVKEAETKIPKPESKWRSWSDGSKYDIFRTLRVTMKEIEEMEEEGHTANAPYSERKAIYMKEIQSLEKRCDVLEIERKRVHTNFVKLQLQLQKQQSVYDKYRKVVQKTREFKALGNFVALEKLSRKQVEDLMARWSIDYAFREDYTRSIQLSLAKRGLSKDGRMQDSTDVLPQMKEEFVDGQ